jgi:hypothetical protein
LLVSNDFGFRAISLLFSALLKLKVTTILHEWLFGFKFHQTKNPPPICDSGFYLVAGERFSQGDSFGRTSGLCAMSPASTPNIQPDDQFIQTPNKKTHRQFLTVGLF